MQNDPGSDPSKKHLAEREKVRKMFDDIAPHYDFLNSFLSAGIHRRWKRRLIRTISKAQPKKILDAATGTCDLAILAARIKPDQIIAYDLSEGMLEAGLIKIRNKGLLEIITTMCGDAEHIPFPDHYFDAAMVSYGVRNFEHPVQGMREICRVLRPGGMFAVLEFSKPRRTPFRQLYQFYFKRILPLVGRMISRHSAAYTYLPESVNRFPEGADFAELMREAGFEDVKYQYLSLGITCLYTGVKG
jgi:demethylmenaquinone methyltransferase/2-methoxy-6-polyprenyl-1,4-benzoquinol methylase